MLTSIYRVILDSLGRRLSLKPNVVGTGVGIKYTAGKSTGEVSIVVLVSKKVKDHLLTNDAKVPRRIFFVKTDVVEVGELIVHAFNPKMKYRPVVPGISIGSPLGTGTAGCFVKDSYGYRYILTNAHVTTSKMYTPITQPGPSDSFGGEVIGRVLGGLFPKNSKGLIDASIVEVYRSVGFGSSDIPEIGHVRGVSDPDFMSIARKTGRTTSYTEAVVLAKHIDTSIKYPDGLQSVKDMLVFGPMSAPGDSGSLIVDKNNKAIALLFAGSDKVTVGIPIGRVLKAFRMSLA